MSILKNETICTRMASLTAAISATPLPDEIITETALCFLDFLASTFAAPMTPKVSETLGIFGTGAARVLHDAAPISIAGAVFAHGFLSTVEDLDDSHALASGMHLSATVFPVALAIAQAHGATQSTFLRATVAGYEVAGRLVRSMDAGLRRRGFHSTGAVGPFGSCAVASILLGLDQRQMAHAFGMAASGAGGLFAFQSTGADSRHLHAANAGHAGLVAAIAAKNDATGPLTAFEGPDGFIGPYSETCDLAFIAKPPPGQGVDYEVMNAYHKRFSACGHAIPAITLALALRQRQGNSIDQIEAIEVIGYLASSKLVNFSARSISQAKFSLPIIVSLAYLFGDVSPAQMNMEVINLPEVQALAQKVRVLEGAEHSAAFPGLRSGSIRVTLTNGERFVMETKTPIGMNGNRLGLHDVARKFQTFAQPMVGANRCQRIADAATGLRDTQDAFPKI